VRILGQVPNVPADIPVQFPPGTPYVPEIGDGWLDANGDLWVFNPA
jgi:hypothetical protein